MNSIPLSTSAISALKTNLRSYFPERKSSHLSESLAAALGFNTHAALKSKLNLKDGDPLYYCLREEKFNFRMQELGYPPEPLFFFNDVKVPEMISTFCTKSYDVKYDSKRRKVWRNLIVCAVNEALHRRLFSLRPGDNRWPISDSVGRSTYLFDFTLPCGLPARAAIYDAGFDEVGINVAVNPNGNWVRSSGGFLAGDAFAKTWLERRRGAWVQTYCESLSCRRKLIQSIADLEIEPQGYADKGRIIL